MGGFVSANSQPVEHVSPAIAGAIWHALFWLVIGNAIGVMIAILLLMPGLNAFLGEWTYGRWMMVHMNTALYGWCSLPMVAVLFKLYGADRGAMQKWCRPVLWLWSGALVVGSASWLSGHSSGKLFLDWSGYARFFFPLAMGGLWLLLVASFVRGRGVHKEGIRAGSVKMLGLLVLLAIPFLIFITASPNLYPVVNPDTGGPTGASQLESSLGIVAILLVLPFAITRRAEGHSAFVRFSWMVLAAEAILCALLGRSDISHHRPAQYLSLGSLLAWLPIMPAYYKAFEWHAGTRRWRTALLWWWSGLVVTGWVLFLPGILDRLKFTDALVGHSLGAVAGFLTAMLIFAMVQLLGEGDAWIFNRSWSFHAWNWGVLAYVVVISVAGWIEGGDPAFTIAPGITRNLLYVARLLTGIAMLAASVEWFVAAFALPKETRVIRGELAGVKAA